MTQRTSIIKGGSNDAQTAGLAEVNGPMAAGSRTKPDPPQTAHSHDPQIEMVKVRGVVRALKVQCPCGETITIDLEYSQQETQPTQ